MMFKLNKSSLFYVFLILLFCSFNFLGCGTRSKVKVKVFNEFDRTFKPKVAVIDFKKDGGSDEKDKPFVVGLVMNPNSSSIIANIFAKELANVEFVDVLDRELTIKTLKEAGYDNQTTINKEDFGSVAKILDVDAILTGTFKRFGFLYPTIIPRVIIKFNAEYFDIKTNAVLWSARVKAHSSRENDERDLARNRIKKVLRKLKKKLNKQ